MVGLTLALTAAATFTTAQPAPSRCSIDDWRRFEQQYATAQDAFQRGDAEPIKALWSHADDVTLFGALGGHERGWAAIGSRLSQVARMNRSGAHKDDEVLTTIVGADLALMVRIEHIPNSGAGAGVGAVSGHKTAPDLVALRSDGHIALIECKRATSAQAKKACSSRC